jgi:hypothetical protein
VPYRFDAITVALAPSHAGTSVQSLHALHEFTIGVVVHGLPDLIAMAHHDGELADRVVHASQSNALFARLENGSLDAALVELRELDAWRVAHPTTPIIATGYTHSIGFNIGYVGLSSSRALLQGVDATVTDLLGQDGMPRLAAAAGMTWLPPRSSHIQVGTVLESLRGD